MNIKYINLEGCVDKNSRMQGIFIQHRLASISDRFPGVLSSNPLNGLSLSETGCFLAHHSLLMSLNESDSTLILEDDVSVCGDFGVKIKILVEKLESSQIDICFLGQTVPFQELSKHAKLLKILREYKKKGAHLLLGADSFYSYGTFAYIVNRNSISKIKDLLRGLDLSGPGKPIDNLLGNWFRQGVLRGCITFPYLVGIESALESTMFDRSAADDHALHAELVNLYLDGHLPNALNRWENIISENPNPHALEICRSIYLRLTRD